MHLMTDLYEYQGKAVDKLRKIKVGALYMEQGTGKTRTTLELVKARLDKKKINAVLWLCPCSVKRNLREDIIYHCGDLPEEIIIRGIESLSSSDRLYLQLLEMVEKYHVYLIVDESNLVKNKDAIRTERIIALSSYCQYKMILNGTPVSKNEADMFAQWYILDWRILGYKSYYSFAANHLEFRQITMPSGKTVTTNQVTNVLNVDYLAEKIAPYTYQILKKDCLKLPEKHYYSTMFFMTDFQENAYAYTKSEYLMNVDEIHEDTIYKLFTALQHVVSGRLVTSSPLERMQTEPLFEDYMENPRMKALKRLIESMGDEKCIIFAKYQHEIDNICDMVQTMGRSCTMFTGKVPQKKRQENRAAFRDDVQFLVANKVCGAYGLNLQFCHNIIYYSNDFDLATRMQSEDRVHRIGQTHDVCIYDIYCPDTIDEFIVDCLSRKERLVDRFKAEIAKIKDRKMDKIEYKTISSKNKDFYAKMGRFFASRQLRNELGGYAISNEDEYFWVVAEYRKEIIGFVGVEPKTKGHDIQAFYVVEKYRKQGIMDNMMREVLRLCSGLITVTVPKSMKSMLKKYSFVAAKEKGKNWINMRRENDEQNISE